MRQIALDTETTGHDIAGGDRVIEIGCLELLDRRPTSSQYHQYLNADRDSHPEALRVHGITTEFLADKPRIAEVVDDFIDYITGAELIIHNAAFDIGFLNSELALCGARYGKVEDHVAGIIDTYKMARDLYPGQRASLNALCRRFDVDLSEREFHGALLDARLLRDVYLALTSGQYDLGFSQDEPEPEHRDAASSTRPIVRDVLVVRATAEELEAHRARMSTIEKTSGQRLWPESPET